MKSTGSIYRFPWFLLCLCLFLAGFPASAADYSGLVWKRQGDWRLNGSSTTLRLGESIPQGALLTAAGNGTRSLVILLPDGQRLLFECYQTETCTQGFRVPALATPPAAAVWAMFQGVSDVLLMRPAQEELPFPAPAGREEDAGNVETVAALQAGSVSIAPALRILPAGSYKLVVSRDGPQPALVTALPSRSLEWNPARTIASVPVAEPGVYRIAVVDKSQVPRMEVEVLATPPALVEAESEALKNARSTVVGWNKTHEGWSLHDFLRAYLQFRAKGFADRKL